MNIFQKIPASIYSPKFYKSLIGSSLGSALGYFFFLILLIMLFFSVLAIPDLLKSAPDIKKYETELVESYPQELVINIKGGQVSTNVPEPYYLTYQGKNIAVIDTKTPYSAHAFDNYKVAVWLTRDSIFYKSEDDLSQIKTVSLDKAQDYKVDRGTTDLLKSKVDPFIPYIVPALSVFVFVFMYFFYSLRLLYNFFLAFLIWLVLKIMQRSISYGDSYKIGLYAMTLAFLVDLVLLFLGVTGFAFMFTVISLAVVLVNFLGNRKA